MFLMLETPLCPCNAGTRPPDLLLGRARSPTGIPRTQGPTTLVGWSWAHKHRPYVGRPLWRGRFSVQVTPVGEIGRTVDRGYSLRWSQKRRYTPPIESWCVLKESRTPHRRPCMRTFLLRTAHSRFPRTLIQLSFETRTPTTLCIEANNVRCTSRTDSHCVRNMNSFRWTATEFGKMTVRDLIQHRYCITLCYVE